MHIRTHTHAHKHTRTDVCTHSHTCTHTHARAHTHTHTHTHRHTHTDKQTHTRTHTHAHIHTRARTHTPCLGFFAGKGALKRFHVDRFKGKVGEAEVGTANKSLLKPRQLMEKCGEEIVKKAYSHKLPVLHCVPMGHR